MQISKSIDISANIFDVWETQLILSLMTKIVDVQTFKPLRKHVLTSQKC